MRFACALAEAMLLTTENEAIYPFLREIAARVLAAPAAPPGPGGATSTWEVIGKPSPVL